MSAETFRCGHAKTPLTIYRFLYKGKEYQQCRVCKLEKNRAYYRDHPERRFVARLVPRKAAIARLHTAVSSWPVSGGNGFGQLTGVEVGE